MATEGTAGAGRLLISRTSLLFTSSLSQLSAGTYLVAVLAERVALVDVELESEDGPAGVAAETLPVVSLAPG